MYADRRSRLILRISEIAPEGRMQDRFCRATRSILGTDSAMLLLMSEAGADVHLIASSDAESPEAPRFALGEGPLVEAFATGEAVLAPDLANDGNQWPSFTKNALAEGTRAALAFPLRVGAIHLGVLYLRRVQPGGLSDEELADAYALADIATWILLEIQAGAETGEIGEELHADWDHRAVVHQATGIISVRLQIPLGEALIRIRAAAAAEQRTTNTIAADVVAGHRTFER